MARYCLGAWQRAGKAAENWESLIKGMGNRGGNEQLASPCLAWRNHCTCSASVDVAGWTKLLPGALPSSVSHGLNTQTQLLQNKSQGKSQETFPAIPEWLVMAEGEAQNEGQQLVESQNQSGWKNLLKSLSPTVSPAFPRPPLTHVPK